MRFILCMFLLDGIFNCLAAGPENLFEEIYKKMEFHRDNLEIEDLCKQIYAELKRMPIGWSACVSRNIVDENFLTRKDCFRLAICGERTWGEGKRKKVLELIGREIWLRTDLSFKEAQKEEVQIAILKNLLEKVREAQKELVDFAKDHVEQSGDLGEDEGENPNL